MLATTLARSLDLSDDDVRAAYYTALLQHIGCVGYAHETARLFLDELVANRAAARMDAGSARDVVVTFLPILTRGRPPLARLRLLARAITSGGEWGREFTATACELGRDTAQRLGLPVAVQDCLLHVYDCGAVLFESTGGGAVGAEAVRRRAGGMLDPALAAGFADSGVEWLAECDRAGAVLDAEPHPWATALDLRRIAEVFGDLADLKSPFLTGHSRAVAALASGAAPHLGLDPAAAYPNPYPNGDLAQV